MYIVTHLSIFSTTGNLLAIGDLTNITYALSPLKPNTFDMRNRINLQVLVAASALASFTAQADVIINETNFPDYDFRYYVKNEHFYYLGGHEVYPGSDGVLTDAELDTYWDMNPSYHHTTIESLQGIEYFTSLRVLTCYNNDLTTVDLSNNKQLELLTIYYN